MSNELVQAYLNKFPQKGETGQMLLYIMFTCRQLDISFQMGFDHATWITRDEQGNTKLPQERQGYQVTIDERYQIDAETGKEIYYKDLSDLAAAGLYLLRVAMEKRVEKPRTNALDRNLIISDN